MFDPVFEGVFEAGIRNRAGLTDRPSLDHTDAIAREKR